MRVGEAAAFERNDGIETLGADDPNAIAVLNFIICWNLINMRDNVVDVECNKNYSIRRCSCLIKNDRYHRSSVNEWK